MKTVLVVDDEDSLRAIVIDTLKAEGHKTMEADNGLQAFELAKAYLPDLIISDVMMHSGSGFILHEFLKRETATAKIPLILISGKALSAGAWGSDSAVEYLSKPFTIPELLSAIRRKIGPKADIL